MVCEFSGSLLSVDTEVTDAEEKVGRAPGTLPDADVIVAPGVEPGPGGLLPLLVCPGAPGPPPFGVEPGGSPPDVDPDGAGGTGWDEGGGTCGREESDVVVVVVVVVVVEMVEDEDTETFCLITDPDASCASSTLNSSPVVCILI